MIKSRHGLRSSIESCLLKTPPGGESDILELSVLIILYLFRGCHQQTIRMWVKSFPERWFDFLTWRRGLPNNGELLLGCKCFIYSLANTPLTAEECQITEEDADLLSQVYENESVFNLFESLKLENRPSMKPSQFQVLLAKHLHSGDVDSFCNSFIHKNLRFLTMMYNTDFGQLKSELICDALVAVYKAYPLESSGQLRATAKVAIRNSGKNLIESYTAQSRDTRTQIRKGESEARVYSISAVMEERFFEMHQEEGSHEQSLWNDTQSNWETRFDLSEMIEKTPLSLKERTFLELLLGIENKNFSEHLGKDHTKVFDTWSDKRYMNAVRNYLGITPEEISSLYARMRGEK